MTDWTEFDPQEILRRLTMRGVDFVVVGGFAAVIHGSPRLTQDLDLTYSHDPANLTALGAELTTMNARLYGIDEDVPFTPDADTLRRTASLTLQTDLGKLDLLGRPSGSPPFETLRAAAERVDVGGMLVAIASIPDLLSMKRSAGRPKDLADIAELEAIERLRDRP